MSALLAVVASLLAFAFALADSALLHGAYEPGVEPPGMRREARHRALAFARVVAQLAAGLGVALALDLPRRGGWSALGLALLAGSVLVPLTEFAARSLGDRLGDRALGPLRPVVRLAELLLAPVVALGQRTDAALLRALPPQEPSDVSREETAEQFREIVAAEAEVTEPERALLAGVFALGDTQVSEIMVPRVDVLGVERDTPWSELVDRVRSAEHSRVPVYDETIDDIVGVLNAKDLLPAIIAGEEPANGWAALVRPAMFIPGTKRIDALLRDFRAGGAHMAVVVDEYGGTAGIVTIEDVLEEIVGEIRDERDDEEAPIEAEDGRRWWVSARVTLDELSEVLGTEFAHDEVSTVGGLVYELLGRVPRAGEQLQIAGFRVVVERVIRRKIQRVYFERLEQGAAEPVALADERETPSTQAPRGRAERIARPGDRPPPADAARAAARRDEAAGEAR